MFLKTSVSCAAKPFTVFTRFGIRSARRCRATSTLLQAALTLSRWVTRSLRTLTYLLHAPMASSTITTMAMSPVFICLLQLSDAVDRLDDSGYPLHIVCQQSCRIHVARLDALLPQIQHALEHVRLDTEAVARTGDGFAFG